MSPEQARGRAVDKRTDIWSFGCVLYECFAGRQTFEGETVSDLVAQILQTEPDWSALPAATPAHVRALLARCLQKDARMRLRDIGDARITLESPPEPELRVTTPPRSPVVWRWMAFAAAALAVEALVIATTLWSDRCSQPGPVRKFDMLAKEMVAEFPVAPRLSPDGTRFAYASKHQIWVRDLSQLAPRPVAEVAEAAAINWSPDSRPPATGPRRARSLRPGWIQSMIRHSEPSPDSSSFSPTAIGAVTTSRRTGNDCCSPAHWKAAASLISTWCWCRTGSRSSRASARKAPLAYHALHESVTA